jgi:hypothetical protein
MNDGESSQAAKLDSDHGDVDPSLGAGFGRFIIAHQSPVVHQPAESAFYDPATRQYVEALGGIGTFDDLDGQFGTKFLDPLGEGFSGVAAIHPQNAQPGEPTQDASQQSLGSLAFGGVGGGDGRPQHQSQSIHQQMPLAAFDALAGVIANAPTVTGRFDTLTVQDGGGGPTALAVGSAHQDAQGIMNHGPLMVDHPLPENVINRFPVGKVGGQITPRTATFDQIEDRIDNVPPIFGRASASGRFGKHGLEISPLRISKVRVVIGDFHRLNGATAKDGPHKTPVKSSVFYTSSQNQLFQTDSYEYNTPNRYYDDVISWIADYIGLRVFICLPHESRSCPPLSWDTSGCASDCPSVEKLPIRPPRSWRFGLRLLGYSAFGGI